MVLIKSTGRCESGRRVLPLWRRFTQHFTSFAEIQGHGDTAAQFNHRVLYKARSQTTFAHVHAYFLLLYLDYIGLSASI